MKFSQVMIFLILLAVQSKAFWGYGLQGGLQGCGYNTSMGDEASSYKDEIDELKKQIREWKKERDQFKRLLSQEERNLRKLDDGLRRSFDPEAYDFIKTHFEERNRCSDYKGYELESTKVKGTTATVGSDDQAFYNTPSAATEEEIPPAGAAAARRQGQRGDSNQSIQIQRLKQTGRGNGSLLEKIGQLSRMPASHDDYDDDKDYGPSEIEPAQLAKEWESVCSRTDNRKGRLSSEICKKRYLRDNSRVDMTTCRGAIAGYPKSYAEKERLKREIEIKDQAIKDAVAQIPELQKSAREERVEAQRQRIEEIREGGVCYSCLANSSYGSEERETNWGGVIGNGLMALLAYKATGNFYDTVSDKNANLGIPTQVPMMSPFMAAAPYVMGAIGAGLGEGGFGCAGMSGGIGGMGGLFGPYAALGGMGQIGGAFGLPPWALGGALGGGMYLPGVSPWGMNGPWGLNGAGLGLFPQLSAMGGIGLGLPGMNGMMMAGVDPMMAALMGQGGLGGLAGLGMGANLMNPYSSLGGYPYGLVGGAGIPGIMGMGGLGGLGGLGGGNFGMQQQMMQMQMQQQQMLMQQQMRYYENAMQKQRALSGLQTELMGVLQRINTIQYTGGMAGLGGSSLLGVGNQFQFGASGSLGGLPSGVLPNPAPINSR